MLFLKLSSWVHRCSLNKQSFLVSWQCRTSSMEKRLFLCYQASWHICKITALSSVAPSSRFLTCVTALQSKHRAEFPSITQKLQEFPELREQKQKQKKSVTKLRLEPPTLCLGPVLHLAMYQQPTAGERYLSPQRRVEALAAVTSLWPTEWITLKWLIMQTSSGCSETVTERERRYDKSANIYLLIIIGVLITSC